MRIILLVMVWLLFEAVQGAQRDGFSQHHLLRLRHISPCQITERPRMHDLQKHWRNMWTVNLTDSVTWTDKNSTENARETERERESHWPCPCINKGQIINLLPGPYFSVWVSTLDSYGLVHTADRLQLVSTLYILSSTTFFGCRAHSCLPPTPTRST